MRYLVQVVLATILGAGVALADNPAVTIQVDTTRNVHPINPNIYGLNHADTPTLNALNSPLNRFGGNRRSRYHWQLNVDSTASDFFFESFPFANIPGEQADTFVGQTRAAGAQPMVTVPMLDFIAKTNPARDVLCSFSIVKYGAQTGNDAAFNPDCGNGILLDGTFVVGNDPLDANVANSPAFQQTFVQHLVSLWGSAAGGGVRYYILDNEHGIWHQTHRDVHPQGASANEIRQKMIEYATMIKTVDPGALVVGPEEFGWTGYFLSGLDIKTCDDAEAMGDFTCYPNPPEQGVHGGNYVGYLLGQLRAVEIATGRRLLDVFTLHYYPQAGGVFGGAVDDATQDRRSRTTRSLWDPTYVDESFIGEPVRLVPRMRDWVNSFYPGTPTGITEYHWGAENHVNGGTTQADVLGIFGREGLDMATLYTDDPLPLGTFIARAFQIYRNYDGQKSAFGDMSIHTLAAHAGADPLANGFGAYGALRSSDGALTLMVVSKYRTENTPVQLDLLGFQPGGSAEVWQFSGASGGAITRLSDVPVGPAGFSYTVPPQSVTLFVVRQALAPSPFDFDGRDDLAIYRGVTGQWIVTRSLGGINTITWGDPALADQPLSGDFDGDGQGDLVVYRGATGQWFVLLSGGGAIILTWGDPSALDQPVMGDFDGDGKADITVYRGVTGQWFVLLSGGGAIILTWGDPAQLDVPAPGDFDGDGKTDITVYRRRFGQWFALLSGGGAIILTWGDPAQDDVPVAGKYDADNRSDIAVYRRASGQWFVLNSGGGATILTWGDPAQQDVPAPADYDGDGRTDIAVWRRADGNWFIIRSGGGISIVNTGPPVPGDQPVPLRRR